MVERSASRTPVAQLLHKACQRADSLFSHAVGKPALTRSQFAVLNAVKRLKDTARSIRRDGHALYLAARDPRVPWHVKALAAALAAYALSPIDLIPDFIPVLGYLDELILLPIAIAGVIRLIDPAIMSGHRDAAARAEGKPISMAAAVAIVLIWTLAITGTTWLLWRWLSI